MTVGPDSSFVNFVILVESVDLVPDMDLCTSPDVFSLFVPDDFNLPTFDLFIVFPGLRIFPYMKNNSLLMRKKTFSLHEEKNLLIRKPSIKFKEKLPRNGFIKNESAFASLARLPQKIYPHAHPVQYHSRNNSFP